MKGLTCDHFAIVGEHQLSMNVLIEVPSASLVGLAFTMVK